MDTMDVDKIFMEALIVALCALECTMYHGGYSLLAKYCVPECIEKMRSQIQNFLERLRS